MYRFKFWGGWLLLIGISSGFYCQRNPKASEIIQRIKIKSEIPWSEETVDTYKSGHPDVEITGIATTFLATMEVLEEAKRQNLNMIITHEPTYYNHFDHLDTYGEDPIVALKRKYIQENNLVVFRFHDHIHQMEQDGIYKGIVEDLGWKRYEKSVRPYLYRLPITSLKDLAQKLQDHYPDANIRVVGDPDLQVEMVSLVLGAAGAQRQIESLQLENVQVVIAGETHEWETVEYIRDARAFGKEKALILLGHAHSEEGGMRYCADWLQSFIKEVPVKFIAAGDPFWSIDRN